MGQKNRKKLETEEELLDTFIALLSEAVPDTEEEVDAFLVERGYNLEELGTRAERVSKPALEASPLNRRNRARQGINAARKKMLESIRHKLTDREDIIAAIQALQMRPGPAIRAHFRNIDFDDHSVADLQSILEEFEFLQGEDEGKSAEDE